LVPYRSNRSALKVATHQDYEMAVLRLLSGERGYVSLDPAEVQEALRREAAESIRIRACSASSPTRCSA